MTARILITGARDWPSRTAVWDAISLAVRDLGTIDVVIVHGACPTGADQFAAEWAQVQGVPEEAHPAQWGQHGRAAGPIRNQEMVDLGADLCLAFPLPHSRGTKDCGRRAWQADIPVRVVEAA